MDIQDLVLVGKLSEVVNFKTKDGKMLEIVLVTPTAEEVKKMGAGDGLTAIDFISNFITRIGDKSYGAEDRQILKDGLGQIQGAVIGYLNQQCMALVERQEKFVEELTKK